MTKRNGVHILLGTIAKFKSAPLKEFVSSLKRVARVNSPGETGSPRPNVGLMVYKKRRRLILKSENPSIASKPTSGKLHEKVTSVTQHRVSFMKMVF